MAPAGRLSMVCAGGSLCDPAVGLAETPVRPVWGKAVAQGSNNSCPAALTRHVQRHDRLSQSRFITGWPTPRDGHFDLSIFTSEVARKIRPEGRIVS